MSASPYIRRATTSVLVAVALLGGTILLLGDRFDAAPGYALTGYALTQPSLMSGGQVAACVAEESMRLIDTGRERCQTGEMTLASERMPSPAATGLAGPAGAPGTAGPPGTPGRSGADGVAGFEIVTAKLAVAKGQSAAGAARCPAGKVALGGGVLPDLETPGLAGDPEDRMDVIVSAPLLPGKAEEAGYGWQATVKNTGGPTLSLVIAALCVTLR